MELLQSFTISLLKKLNLPIPQTESPCHTSTNEPKSDRLFPPKIMQHKIIQRFIKQALFMKQKHNNPMNKNYKVRKKIYVKIPK